MDDAQLKTVWQQRQFTDTTEHLSQSLTMLMKHTLEKRLRRLWRLAALWDEVIPESIREHTALEGFSAGVLKVIVDSASHRFQLHTLLRGGLMRQLQAGFSGVLNKVHLVPGQFYSVDLAGQSRYLF